MAPELDGSRLTARLAEAADAHRVPGASAAVLVGGRVVEAACGVLNTTTGVEATEDSLFQIGSITKSYTATLLMRLVDRGALTLDTPVVDVLPKFSVADPEVTSRVTVRHLLCHTSGIDGDHFLDTGRGDDCVERYVESLAEVGQTHALGATMSYCNAGYTVLGRILEEVAGASWDAVLRDELVTPLGLTHTVTLPEEALRFRAAIGHTGKPGEPQQPVPVWGLMRSAGPAGLICARAADVIAFARMHLDGGVASDGTRILSGTSVQAMQAPQVAVPDRWTLGDHWGLGWILFDWGGRRVFGHDGSTLGQAAFLRLIPDRGIAIALLTNGGSAGDLYQDLFRGLVGELGGVEMPTRPQPTATPPAVDLEPYTGTYERSASRIEIAVVDGELRATITAKGPLAALVPNPVQELTLVAVDAGEHLFVTRPEGVDTWTPAVFFQTDDGRRYLHFGARATPKVD
jgi:CubicO group peptidase (beta-lactamase class C family)